MMNKKRFCPFLLLIPLAIAFIAGWFLLPDTLIMQVSMSRQPSKSMPNVLGLLAPMAAGIPGAAYASSEKEDRRPRDLIILASAVAIRAVTFVFNL